jgi:hypothetical protein
MTSIRTTVALGAAVLALVFGGAGVSTAMMFGHNGGAEPAKPAAAEAPAAEGEIDQARLEAGVAAYKAAGCRGCHGWASNGEREGPNPPGPSLRATSLDMDAIRETIACGRPGTPMPYFSKDAWKRGSTDCYGATAADLGDQMPTKAKTRLTPQKVEDIAYYIANYVKGKGDITLEECELFFGKGDSHCTPYAVSN